MTVNDQKESYQTVTPYLIIENVSGFIDFMKSTFGAKDARIFKTPDGRIMHAEIQVGDSSIMMGEPGGSFKPIPGTHHVYVEDTDATYQKALDAGAESVMEPADQFYGDRSAGVKDRWGNYWWLATHLEDLSEEEIRQRMEKQFAG